jgi:hypothetical protein
MLRTHPFLATLLVLLLCFASPVRAAEPHWIRVDSSHFSVLTDANEKKRREVNVRFEQMRVVFSQLLLRNRLNMPKPIDIIALRSDEEYAKVAPARQGEGLGAAFFIPGDDRDYFVLNLSQEDSWRAVSYEFAQVLLNYNYPPAQDWFDEGLAEYFSSLHLTDKQMQLGGDPKTGSPAKSFVDLLSGSTWLSLPELFSKHETSGASEGKRGTLFEAESWIVMHYLLNMDKLSATGTYLGLVENEKQPVEQAIQNAYGMTAAQLEKAVKDYFHSLVPALQAQVAGKPTGTGGPLSPVPAPLTADLIATSTPPVLAPEAQALVAEMSRRLPEHRDQTLKILEAITQDPNTDSVVARRALGCDAMDRKDFDGSIDQLGKAAALDAKDPWTHYYLSLWKYREAQSSGHETRGLANLQQDLHIVLDWDHEFVEAYSMLAMAQMEGGGLRTASDSIRAAIQLAPRNQRYLLQLATIYMAGKNWDAATALLERLANGSDPEVAETARKDLQDLPTLKKYGILPQLPAPNQTAQTTPAPSTSAAQPATPKKTTNNAERAKETNEENQDQAPPEPQIDKRPISYLKGKLVSVDCTQAPIAVITISAGIRTLRLRTADYKALILVGADQFSCDWTDRLISVNYKAGGKADGDLVSLEMR